MFTNAASRSLLYKGIWAGLWLCVCGYASVAAAATNISSPITTDMVWSQAGSPYVVSGAVAIATGATLTIEQGTVVKFQSSAGLTVSGRLLIQGQTDLPVSLTSIHDDAVGGDTNQNGTSTLPGVVSQRWSGVTFLSGSTGDITQARFIFAGYERTGVPPRPAVYNQGGTVTLRHSTIEQNRAFGAGQTVGSFTVEDSVFDNQTIGMAVKNGDIAIARTIFKNSGHFGLMVGGVGAYSLFDSEFRNNYNAAGLWLDGERQIQMGGNQASGGDYSGILLRGPVAGNVTLPEAGGLSYIVSGVGGSPIGSGELSFVDSSNVLIDIGTSLTLKAGAILKAGAEEGVEVKGSLNIFGTPADPVVFTSISDNTIGGVVRASLSTPPSPGSGGYIRFYQGSAGEIKYATIRYGSNAYRSNLTTVLNNGGVVNITDSIITENKQLALYQASGSSTVHDSWVGDAGGSGILNTSATTLDATNNYWGDPTGPKHPTINPAGLGAIVSDNVNVTPWLGAYPPEPPPLTGASSVLFLPGIQASRLYKEGLFGIGEDQVWPPNALFNEDIYDMSMSQSGVSAEAIYGRYH